jgi:hypothetical protein
MLSLRFKYKVLFIQEAKRLLYKQPWVPNPVVLQCLYKPKKAFYAKALNL